MRIGGEEAQLELPSPILSGLGVVEEKGVARVVETWEGWDMTIQTFHGRQGSRSPSSYSSKGGPSRSPSVDDLTPEERARRKRLYRGGEVRGGRPRVRLLPLVGEVTQASVRAHAGTQLCSGRQWTCEWLEDRTTVHGKCGWFGAIAFQRRCDECKHEQVPARAEVEGVDECPRE